MAQNTQAILCPQCEDRELNTVATAPYARGFLVAYQAGSKKIVGCRPCVASGLRKEAGKSLLFGWFSITALIANVFFIPWNLFRSFIVKEDDLAVGKFFDEIGVPKPGTEYRLTDAFYSAVAASIRADGKIEDTEIHAAKSLGQQMLPDYDPNELDKLLAQKGSTQPISAIATVFRVYLTPEGQGMVFKYLMGIAIADGDFAKSEDKYMEKLAVAMGLGAKAYKEIRANLLDTA